MTLVSLDFLAIDAQWPPPEESARLDQYAANKKLFEGRHEEVYDQWFRLLRSDQAAVLEIVVNWPKRLSTLWADLTIGEPPRFTVGERDSPEQERLRELLGSLRYNNTLYETVIDVSRYGVAVLKTGLRDGRATVTVQPPYTWFPVASPGDVREIQHHVLAFTYEETDTGILRRERKTTYLKAEIHDRGSIEHRLYRVANGRIQQEMSVERLRRDFPGIGGEVRDGRVVEETGVDDFLVQFVPGVRGSDALFGLDDYRDVEGLVQEFEVRIAQISRVLDEHADPNMYGPSSALTVDPITGNPVFEGGGKFFPVDEAGTQPGYMAWDGQLAAAFRQLDTLMEQFYLVSETSPAAFGKMDAGLAPSGTALRRLMHAPLAKASRLVMNLDPVAKRVLELCGELEDANTLEVGAPLDALQITWNDGLPQDENEQTTIEATRVQAGITSRFSAIKRLYGYDDDQAQAELERIREEEAQATPNPLNALLNP